MMEKKQTFGELFRRWGLKSVKLNVKFAQLEFEATDDDMTAAWDMYVELITRIATQEFYCSGRCRRSWLCTMWIKT